MKRMHGIIVPIVTPFTKDDAVDGQAIHRLVAYLAKKGVDSIYPNGTTGEMLKLSVAERKFVAEEALDEARKNGIDCFIQVGAPTLKETIELARHALEIGSDGIGVVTPQFFGVNFREMVEFYVAVSKSLPDDFPIYLYNIPQCAANDITPEMVEEIVRRTKNVVGIKYSYSDFIRLKNYINCNDGKFDVVIGPDRLFLPGMSIGCVGTVTGCAQCQPEPFVETLRMFQSGDTHGAMLAQRKATELCEIVKAGANMGYFKSALEFNGLGEMHMRAPALDLTQEEKNKLVGELESYQKKYNYSGSVK